MERAIRDLLISEVPAPYQLNEVRLRSEQVVLKPGLSRNAEQLIKMSQEEVPITVTDVEDAVSRLRALFVAFDYLGVLAFSPFVSAGTPQVRGGSIEYLKLMEQKRNKTPGLVLSSCLTGLQGKRFTSL